MVDDCQFSILFGFNWCICEIDLLDLCNAVIGSASVCDWLNIWTHKFQSDIFCRVM